MTDTEFRALLDLMMCSDPWPINDRTVNGSNVSQNILIEFADKESKLRGYDNWIVAYHEVKP